MNPHLPVTASTELLILIRGGKKTGKTSLLKRMSGRPVSENYEASTITQKTTIKWKPANNQETIVTITLLDVVSMNPRLTTTAHGAPQGIIILYDPRDSESVTYAAQVIENTPSNIPIALLTNFQDVITADLHPMLRAYSNRCFPISSSMITNLGLAELSHWLELPLTLNVYNAYNKLLNYSKKEIARLQSMFQPGLAHRVINLGPARDDDGFWSDDEKSPIQMFPINKNQTFINPNSIIPTLHPQPDVQNSNNTPMSKDDELMQAIIQTASRSKMIIGKDEMEYEDLQKMQQNNQKNQFSPYNSASNPQFYSQAQISAMNHPERRRHHHSSRTGEKRRHHHRQSKNNDFVPPAVIGSFTQQNAYTPPTSANQPFQNSNRRDIGASSANLSNQPYQIGNSQPSTTGPPPSRSDYLTI